MPKKFIINVSLCVLLGLGRTETSVFRNMVKKNMLTILYFTTLGGLLKVKLVHVLLIKSL